MDVRARIVVSSLQSHRDGCFCKIKLVSWIFIPAMKFSKTYPLGVVRPMLSPRGVPLLLADDAPHADDALSQSSSSSWVDEYRRFADGTGAIITFGDAPENGDARYVGWTRVTGAPGLKNCPCCVGVICPYRGVWDVCGVIIRKGVCPLGVYGCKDASL